ncbi:hypothetical protein MMC30_000331, partial [Trapelia coarctata]|nr:hypothetical protein [Trapelia coarctata]
STPSAPSNCPAVRKVSRLGPDDVIFSRQGTKKAYTLYKGAEHVLDMCTIAGGVLGGGYGGIPRGLRVSGRISWQTMQMSVQEKTSA